ncbi:hypothetical protein NA57DRAFT_76820 [Rhizodiscina lignyota]|uniref:ER transporter 6TM N-terminal domain-containing protein n=1 Tax=Rhizodiscina lignyota TaxID=1504668 RepID=A0A9P4M5F9_9PEZI|nr:hypothetical protein NA57DRAFT_76820 [Rhizodiscina lignyota]
MASSEEKPDAELKQDASDAELKQNASDDTYMDKAEDKAGNGTALKSNEVAEEVDSPFFLDKDGKPRKEKALPPWLDHFNLRDLKILFKCSIAVWVYTLFIFINPVLRTYGQATFFGCILLFIIPCNGIVFIQALGCLTLLLGMAMGWGWGVITMKAALSTRPAAETQARLQELGRTAQQLANNTEQASGQAEYTQILVFEGFMLDTRISITYFGMICIFVYFMARLRAKVPKLALMAMFSWIIMDIFLVIAPLIPSFNGTIAQLLLKPAATGAGVGLVCNIFLFPESTSHKTLFDMQNVLRPMKDFFSACLTSFSHPEARFNLLKLQQAKGGTIMAYKEVQASLGFLPLDLSTCRWNAEDITSLQEPMTKVVTMYAGLMQLQISRVEARTRHRTMNDIEEALQSGDDTKKGAVGAHQLALALDTRHKLHHPQTEDLLWKSMQALMDSSHDILLSCSDAIEAMVEAIENVNERRWFRHLSTEQCEQLSTKHSDVLQKLNQHITEFASMATDRLMDPHAHLFDENGHLIPTNDSDDTVVPVHGLMLGLLFEERILGVARSLDMLLKRIVELEKGRTKNRIWFPTGIRHFFAWAVGATPTPSVGALGDTGPGELERVETVVEQEKQSKKSKRAQRKEKTETDAHETGIQLETLRYHAGRQRSPLSKFVLAVTNWLTNDDALFATRVVIVTIAVGVPAVCTSSAGFYYREKGLWALIMAQMGMGTYTSDFVYGLVLRISGTVFGGIIGMACWYIGAGNGPGNPYGMAAIMGVVTILLMWGRLFTGFQFMQFWMLMAATVYLTMAYSWVDTHIPSYGNPGVGYNVFWRRMLLVIVGFGASAIVMFFPRPPSASRHFRQVMSGTIRNIKDLYALFVATFNDPYDGLLDTVEKEALAIGNTQSSLMGPLKMLKLEFSSSSFDSDTLVKLNALCMTINSAMVQMIVFSAKLPQHLKDRFARLSGALDENIIGDIMAVLTLIEQTLKTSDPLPAVLPVPLTARCLGLQRKVQKLQAGEDVVSKDMIMNEDYRKYCVVVSSFVQFINATDELVMIVKSACGETHLVDVESWPLMTREAEADS